MALMINGKKVVGYALGGTEFYSIGENADYSISVKGRTYIWEPEASSDSLTCSFTSDTTTTTPGVSVGLSQKLYDNSATTVKDLIDKGEIIKLIVTFHDTYTNTDYSSHSGIIDFSKPDSNGHFNFQWTDSNISSNTYCYPDSGANTFSVYSDTYRTYPGNDSYIYYMVILSDES